jgi:hypothetical protein
MYLAASALVPLLPLVLFKYPIADLIANFFGRLSGRYEPDDQLRQSGLVRQQVERPNRAYRVEDDEDR